MKQELLVMLKELEEVGDVIFFNNDNVIKVDFNDFYGFTSNGEELMRPYTNEELVNKVISFLNNNCVSKSGDFYVNYHFNDFVVVVGFSSYDI